MGKGIAKSKSECGSDWRKHLAKELSDISMIKDHARRGTFDMDDGPELARVELDSFPTVKRALEFLQSELRPQWKAFDEQALSQQAKHKRMTQLAIWPGVAAVSMAIVILVISHFFPQIATYLTVVELAAVLLAAVAVISGLTAGFHHGWLTARQIAERLRSLKFAALGWHELWCDWDEWCRFVRNEMADLANLSDHDAEEWAKAGEDEAVIEGVGDPQCAVNSDEASALADYYRIKRLEFQRHYFDVQSHKADLSSWSHRYKVSLVLFAISVVCVIGHGALSLIATVGKPGEKADLGGAWGHLPAAMVAAGPGQQDGAHSALHVWEITLVGLAALFPVIGFGIRAWVSAFEFPRSRNLFRSKSRALKHSIDALTNFTDAPRQDALPMPMTSANSIVLLLQTMMLNEHFFIAEHREWCRLQTEAEWYF